MAVGDAEEKASDQPPQGAQPSPQAGPRLTPWSAFAFRDYRILWLSNVAQLVTMQMRLLVTTVWLYQETESGLQLGFLGLVQLSTQIPAILFGGTLADDVDRKKLMAVTQAFSFALISLMAALVVMDSLVPWHIYVVTAVLGVANVLGSPARAALTANIVPRTHLMHAITSNSATFQLGSILAPLAFAGAITQFGVKPTFAVTAAFALPSVILPLMIRTSGLPEDKGQKTAVLKRMWEGFLFVKSHPILPGLYIMDIGVTVFTFYRQVLPLLVDKLFRAGEGAVGVLIAANSAGGVAGSFIVFFLARFRPKGNLVIASTLVFGLLIILFGFSASLWMATIIMVALGTTDSIGMATRHTTVQLTTPDNMRGRATSFQSFSAMNANGLGTFQVGLMSDQIGAANALILGGIIAVIVVIAVWWFIPGVRRYRYP